MADIKTTSTVSFWEIGKTIPIESITSALTPREAASPYAHFRNIPLYLPEGTISRGLRQGCPMNPAEGWMPNEGRRIVKAGPEASNGYCILPNGVGFSVATIPITNYDETKWRWWDELPDIENLKYKIFCPGAHYRLFPDGVVEDFGNGPVKIAFLKMMGPEDFGISKEELHRLDPDVTEFVGILSHAWPLAASFDTKPEKQILLHYHRMTPAGPVYKLASWIGMHLVDGKPDVDVPERGYDAESVRFYGMHSAQEFTHFNYILPLIYEQFLREKAET